MAAVRKPTITAGGVRTLAPWVLLALACLGSRLATGIYYVEDPDSLRFALAVADGFALAELQPHFPGYPVYWAVCRLAYLATGSLGAAFALVGGAGTFVLCGVLLRMTGWALTSSRGLILVAAVGVNPLLWLMGTRYMPDLSGLALAVLGFGLLTGRLEPAGSSHRWGWLATGLLAGWRLSYLPVLAVPIAWKVARGRVGFRHFLWGATGVLVWLVPMVVDTGWSALWSAAWAQTEGHFTEFGGTVGTRPDLTARGSAFVRAVWADGLGGWWPGRHWLTSIVGLGWAAILAAGFRGLIPWTSPSEPDDREQRAVIVAAVLAGVAYAAWAFFFQNVIHRPRHVLPLLVPLCALGARGTVRLGRAGAGHARTAVRIGLILVGLAYAVVAGVLVGQHGSPSAPAQVRDHLGGMRTPGSEPRRVVSIPLINYYLAGQGVEADYFSVRDSTERRRARALLDRGTTIYVGTRPPAAWPEPSRADTFYHNPYVNRMWARIPVYVFRSPDSE